jgi:hypothetical protein
MKPVRLNRPRNSLQNAVDFLCCRGVTEGQSEPMASHLRRELTDGIKCLRGSGLLGLSPNARNDIWDWAQVTGRWCGGKSCPMNDLFFARWEPPSEKVSADPGYFHLAAVRGADDVLAAMRTQGYDEGRVSSACTFLVQPPEMSKPPTGLPPVYFVGQTEDIPESSRRNGHDRSRFIYGLVHLTNENPPEVRWTMRLEWLSSSTYRRTFSGTQIGVLGSRRGVIGVSKATLRPVQMLRLVFFSEKG